MDAGAFRASHRFDADVLIVGSGLSAMAVLQRVAECGARVIVLEAGGREGDPEAQERYWGGDIDIDGEDAGKWFPPVHAGRRRILGGASTIWGGRCSPLMAEDFAAPPGTRDEAWPISFETLALYSREANEFLHAGRHDYNLDTAPREGDRRAVLAPQDDDRIVEGMERYSLPTDAARHYRAELMERPNVHVLTGATAVEVLASHDRTQVTGIRARNSAGHDITISSRTVVLAAGGLETPRLLLASARDENGVGLGNHHDQVGRYYQTHFWGQCGGIAMPAEIARRMCFARRTSDGVYYKRNLTLSPEERRRQSLLSMCIRPSWGNIADPDQRVPAYSLIFLLRHFIQSELRLYLEHYAARNGRPEREIFLSHLRNIVLGAPQIARFGIERLAIRHLSKRRRPGLMRLHPNGIYGLEFNAEHAPNPDSRVRLGEAVDPLGLRRLVVQWRCQDIDRHTVRETLRTLRAAMNTDTEVIRMNDVEIELMASRLQPAKGHHMGTTRMSATPRTGATDENAQVWGVDGLYVAGPALLATSGFANPTLPAVALSQRLGDHLARRVGKRGPLPARSAERLAVVRREEEKAAARAPAPGLS